MSTKVVVAYCHNGTVQERFNRSLLDLLVYETSKGLRSIELCSAVGPYIEDNRNSIVVEFLKTKAEWLMFFDNDMTFTPDLMDTLFSVADNHRRIVAGFYLTLTDKGAMCSSWLDFGPNGTLQTMGAIKRDHLHEVASVGMGGTLIHRSVFQAISEVRSSLPPDNWIWYGRDLINGIRHGEDVTFCLRARDAGFPSWGYSRAQLGHLKSRCLTIDALTPR